MQSFPVSRVLASHGLGNQLFQFTFAHFLKGQNHSVTFENNPIWSPGLHFTSKSLSASCDHVTFINHPTISHTSVLGRVLFKTNLALPISRRILKVRKLKTYSEPSEYKFSFNPNVLKLTKENRLFSGHWIHWEYVYHERETAVRDILNYLDSYLLPEALLNKSQTNIVLHVRRGDYFNRGNDQLLGVISSHSYLRLIENLRQELGLINLITVSDDFELAKNPLYRNKFGRILTPNICNEWQALSLMAKADYVISANSTFSWWGALFAAMNGGVGIIPKYFYKNLNTNDAFSFPGLLMYDNDHF